MSHHTILPNEALLQNSTPQKLEYKPCKYGIVSGYVTTHGSFCVSHVVTTDLKAFLDPAFFPGTFIPLQDLL